MKEFEHLMWVDPDTGIRYHTKSYCEAVEKACFQRLADKYNEIWDPIIEAILDRMLEIANREI